MIAWILTQQGLDPSYIIGGVSKNLKTNAHAGTGNTFVIEADEYDRMFLGLRPDLAVITNIEHDHPDYFPHFEDIFEAFVEFTDRVNPEGVILINGDDYGARKLIAAGYGDRRKIFTFGLASSGNDYSAEDLVVNRAGGFSYDMKLRLPATPLRDSVTVNLQIPGKHNTLNALAAVAVTHQIGLSIEKAAVALSEFSGTGRRFDVRGEAGGVLVIDDYAHHPTEIKAVLSAAKLRYPGRKIWAVWQPHTYSRTRTLSKEFIKSFDDADHLLVTEIYPSRESQPTDGYSAGHVVRMMDHPDVHFIPDLSDVTTYLLAHLERDDVLLVLSAGDANQIAEDVQTAMEEREHSHV
jgi:UDP-N-acetylmuramate--alanine ligase